MKMGEEIITFDDTEVEKHKFHQHKSAILRYDVDVWYLVYTYGIYKMMVTSKFPFGKKVLQYLIHYIND